MLEVNGRKVDQATAVEESVISHFRRVEGRLKTFLESIAQDADRCEAQKDVVSKLLWMEVKDFIIELTDTLAVE